MGRCTTHPQDRARTDCTWDRFAELHAAITTAAYEVMAALGAPESTVLVVGSAHGIEPAGLGVVSRLQARDITGRNANVWVIKTANPDGTLVLSRGNAHKVDLNRNFPDSTWKVQGVGTVVYGGRIR